MDWEFIIFEINKFLNINIDNNVAKNIFRTTGYTKIYTKIIRNIILGTRQHHSKVL